MSEIVWEEPPVTNRGRRGCDWRAFVAELRAHPGKWAVVRDGATYRGVLAADARLLKIFGCEATTRRAADKPTYVLYARWPEDVS